MDATTVDPPVARHSSAARSARARSQASPRAASKSRKPEAGSRASSRVASKETAAPPFLPIDVELLEDMRDLASRKVRAIVRDKPFVALGGAFAAGFLLGGGWRTRAGRLLLFAANRYLVFQAAKRELGV